MNETHEIELAGCTPEPLMSYLKALGILRLVSEQKDPDARGWWMNDVFRLRSTLDRNVLLKFFQEEYKPTPLFSPWNGDGGFLADTGTSVETVNEFRHDEDPRFRAIRNAIQAVDQIPLMTEFREKRDRAKELEKKKKSQSITDTETEELRAVTKRVKQIKQTVMTGIRAGFPDSSLGWLDCCLTITLDGYLSSPALGSGGVDGRLDFGNNFLVNCRAVLANPQPARPRLTHALFGEPVALEESSIGQFSPGQIGAPNSTQGFEGVSLINRWDFVLMLEGALMFAGAVVRRMGVYSADKAAFPFTVRARAIGGASPAPEEPVASRGELWLPLWDRAVGRTELETLFAEGRADRSSRPARDAVDFARAIAALGVDRGIRSFIRYGFLKRSGKAYLAVAMDRFALPERQLEATELLAQCDGWLDRYRRACGDKYTPPRFKAALRRIESAIFDYCRYSRPEDMGAILVALGRAERELAVTSGKGIGEKCPPLGGLSPDWLTVTHDGSPEFCLALALAGIYDRQAKIGPLRSNLEPVAFAKGHWGWAELGRHVVWNSADLAANMAAVLERRMMDGARASCEDPPLGSRRAVGLDTVAAFMSGDLDDRRIEDFLWGLILIDHRKRYPDRLPHDPVDAPPLPRAFALLKLLFLPRPLAAVRRDEKLCWRLARDGKSGIGIRPETRVLPLLRAGRIGEACRIAAQRLRVSGLAPMPGPLPTGMLRDDTWAERTNDHRRARRLAAALLIPIDSVNHLIHLVCRDQSAAAEALAVPAEGETE